MVSGIPDGNYRLIYCFGTGWNAERVGFGIVLGAWEFDSPTHRAFFDRLYLSPPEPAIVLCVDEKSQVQALDRTRRGLPLKPGRAETMTHDYKRYRTATLFAAMDAATGRVISLCQQRHRHQEWLKFLCLTDKATPLDRQTHLIADNYAPHKYPKVQR